MSLLSFKKNDKQLIKNRRPLSLLPLLSKIFEGEAKYLIKQVSDTRLDQVLRWKADERARKAHSCLFTSKIVFNKLYEHLNQNNLITHNQSGFRPGDGCINQLLYLMSEIYESFESPDSLEVRAVFLDISAFDKFWHEGLIFKLKQNGVRGNSLEFFVSYLSDCHQRVGINGSYSPYSRIESGAPQGSVLKYVPKV